MPWVEHAGWYPACEFVALVRGREFQEAAVRTVTGTVVGASYSVVMLVKEWQPVSADDSPFHYA